MERSKLLGLAVATMITLSASIALAGMWSGWRGSGGWGMGSSYQRMYNPATVETITGTVESVKEMTPMKGMHSGIHLAVKTEKETLDVHLGPEWYVQRLDTKIEKGDKVEIKGSRVTIADKPALIAAEVRKGENTLFLRDSSGIPAWAGWRR